jgi:predicted RNase H-like HicB family nuclease
MKNKDSTKRKKATERSCNTAGHYLYTVQESVEDEADVARVAEFPSLAADGDSQEAALYELQQVVAAVVADVIV